jgi:hypothetical protein
MLILNLNHAIEKVYGLCQNKCKTYKKPKKNNLKKSIIPSVIYKNMNKKKIDNCGLDLTTRGKFKRYKPVVYAIGYNDFIETN